MAALVSFIPLRWSHILTVYGTDVRVSDGGLPVMSILQRQVQEREEVVTTSRRDFLRLTSVPALFVLVGCGRRDDDLPPVGAVGRAALLAPLSGPSSALGQLMVGAVDLGGGGAGEVQVIDAGGTDESAAAAALSAVSAGARILLGPLFSSQSRAAREAVGGRVPIVSLSNDDALAGDGIFVFGITPRNSAKTILGFAASRGLRRIVLVVPPGEFGSRSIAATQAAAQELGLTLAPPVVQASASGVVEAVLSTPWGGPPDGVYVPSLEGAFSEIATSLHQADLQVLGSDQWASAEPERIAPLQDAWFAAPDPIRFEAFELALEEATGARAGVVAGLAYDAVEMARLLGRLGQQDRQGLLRDAGFDGVLGPFRFLSSGLCDRRLGVLSISGRTTTMIGSAA